MSDSTSSLHRVLTALALLREATPAEIATQAGLGYSTVPPKLRHLETDELAMQSPDSGTGKSVRKWTLTPKGILATAVAPDTGAEQMPVEQNTGGENDKNTANVPYIGGADDRDEAAEPHPPVNVTTVIDPTAASDEDTSTDHRDSATHTEPAPASPELDTAHQAEDADQQPEPASSDQARTSVEVNAPEPCPEDASGTAPAESGSAEPAERTAAVTAVDPRSPEPATPPPSAPQHDADAGTGVGAADQDDDPGEAQDGESAVALQVTKPRRRSGNLRAAVLKVLQSNPGQRFTVREVCKAVDAANTDSDAAKASAGAVNNALLKLTNDGLIQQVGDKPAVYQAV